jgi:hypothetical protein
MLFARSETSKKMLPFEGMKQYSSQCHELEDERLSGMNEYSSEDKQPL